MFFVLRDAVELRLQSRVVRRIVEVEREVTDLLHKLVEPGIGLVDTAELDDAFAHVGRKLVAQRPPRHADNGKVLWQQVVLLEMKERGQQLALGQIAGSAKDHQDARIRECARRSSELAKDPRAAPSSAPLLMP